MILALNTAEPIHELALFDPGAGLFFEKRWPEDRKDVETLVPKLEALLTEAGATKEEIKAVLVVKGPGSFTSVRTGVAFANALAEGLSVKLFELSTFELFARKLATTDPVLVVLAAGGLDVGVQSFENAKKSTDAVKVGPIATLLAEFPHDPSLKVIFQVGETAEDELKSIALEKGWQLVAEHERLTLGESLQSLGLDGAHPVDTVQPLYLKGPKITISSDPWKQARSGLC